MEILDENFMALLPEHEERVSQLLDKVNMSVQHIQKARLALFVLVAYSTIQLVALFLTTSTSHWERLWLSLIQLVVFLIFGIFTLPYPKISLIGGLSVFVAANVLNVFIGHTDTGLYIFSFIILFYLAKGINAAFEYEISKKELENFGVKVK